MGLEVIGLVLTGLGTAAKVIGQVQASRASKRAEKARQRAEKAERRRRYREALRQSQFAAATSEAAAGSFGVLGSTAAAAGQFAQSQANAETGLGLRNEQETSNALFRANSQAASAQSLSAVGGGLQSLGGGLITNAQEIRAVIDDTRANFFNKRG